ncbi:TetR/AcrR family transcriptional regulator [Streptomyces sp. NBC_01497]|uniref:TetR/AcrR family transcriptional regulator n=1 Tax=Streptomyces sp. NBC_01497 TaxID=2903885 RepID=UPI002E3560EA|nr:TetR/AcrR family transcriptional regulator [Streptomyces sp. NBC_01497]
MPRAVRERQMMDAAVHVFGRYGYQAASMDGIAEAAGVSKPLVYLYLHSKEDLFAACVRREAEALMTALRAALDPGLAPECQLRSGLSAFFEHTTRHPDGWTVLHRQAHTRGEPFAAEAHQVRRQLVAYVRDLIGAAARAARPSEVARPSRTACPSLNSRQPHSVHGPAEPPGPPEFGDRHLGALAHALVGAAEELAGWANETEGATAREATSALMNLAWTGLGSLLAGARWSAWDRQDTAP